MISAIKEIKKDITDCFGADSLNVHLIFTQTPAYKSLKSKMNDAQNMLAELQCNLTHYYTDLLISYHVDQDYLESQKMSSLWSKINFIKQEMKAQEMDKLQMECAEFAQDDY